MALLDVINLKAYYSTLRGPVKAVDGVNFQIEEGEALGLAGESGCGKTTVALAVLGILPSNGKIVGGKVVYKGTDITKLKESELREKIRWKEISLVFQGAMNAMNPVYKISQQIYEAIRLHEANVTKKEAKERAAKLFELVGLDPSRIDNYPHEFSGGMKQRAMIAMALACNPKLLIADEPSTALDVIIQAQILQLLNELREKLRLSLMLITHDLSIIAETCQKIAIMYAGKIVEYGDIVKVFKEPFHPYAHGLIKSFPDIKAPKSRMVSIPGFPPDLLAPPPGCRFHERCPYAMNICRKEEPAFLEIDKNHFTACHLMKKA